MVRWRKGDESGQLTADTATCHTASLHVANVRFIHNNPLGQQ